MYSPEASEEVVELSVSVEPLKKSNKNNNKLAINDNTTKTKRAKAFALSASKTSKAIKDDNIGWFGLTRDKKLQYQ